MRIDVGDYALAAHVHPAREAQRTAVLLHGFAGTHADWAPVLAAFPPDTTVVALDLIGHGDSDAPTDPAAYTFEAVADALVRAADVLCLDRPTWVGYSFGARLALHVALHHPTRVGGLILESVHPGIAGEEERARRARQDSDDVRRLHRSGLDAFFERWHARPVFDTRRGRSPAWAAEVARKRATNHEAGLGACLGGLGLGVQRPLGEAVRAIEAPTLLVAGALDRTYAALASSLSRAMPHAQLAIVPSAGHAVHAEAPQAWSAATRSFLQTLPVAQPSHAPAQGA